MAVGEEEEPSRKLSMPPYRKTLAGVGDSAPMAYAVFRKSDPLWRDLSSRANYGTLGCPWERFWIGRFLLRAFDERILGIQRQSSLELV